MVILFLGRIPVLLRKKRRAGDVPNYFIFCSCFKGEKSSRSVHSGGILSKVPTRLDDIEQLDHNLTIVKKEYTDRLRFFSGDTPARALEAGGHGRHVAKHREYVIYM